MASNLVKEGVERNSERIFAAIKDSLVDEASVEEYMDSIGIEGYVNSARLPDGSVRVFLSEERPEDVVQSSSPEEEIPESTGFEMSREELDAGLPGISDDLESIGVLASGDNSLTIGSDSISDDNISLLILSSSIPTAKPKSPTRLTNIALIADLFACNLVYQKLIKR